MELTIHVYHHVVQTGDGPVMARLDSVISLLTAIGVKETKMAKTIDDLVTAVAAEKDEVASVKAFVVGIKQQLADALSGANLPPAVQAKVDAVFAGMTENTTALADAITTAPDDGSGTGGIPPVGNA